jgi:hypothetical protein
MRTVPIATLVALCFASSVSQASADDVAEAGSAPTSAALERVDYLDERVLVLLQGKDVPLISAPDSISATCSVTCGGSTSSRDCPAGQTCTCYCDGANEPQCDCK